MEAAPFISTQEDSFYCQTFCHHGRFMDRRETERVAWSFLQAACLLKCNNYLAIGLISDFDWIEKCRNNRVVYFNYIKFPGSQQK